MLLEHAQEVLAAPAAISAAAAVGTSVGVYVGCMYTGADKGLVLHLDALTPEAMSMLAAVAAVKPRLHPSVQSTWMVCFCLRAQQTPTPTP